MKSNIPNLLTLMNVLSGSLAVIFAVRNQWEIMAGLVFLGLVFDFFDGLSARLLHVQSPLGLQLDSLADMITFGLVPGIVMFQLLSMSLTGAGGMEVNGLSQPDNIMRIIPFFGFTITGHTIRHCFPQSFLNGKINQMGYSNQKNKLL